MKDDLNTASCELVQALAVLNLLAEEIKGEGLGEVAYAAMSLVEMANVRVNKAIEVTA